MTREERIFRCWKRGMGIRQTIRALRVTDGVHLTFEEVRLHFVTLSERFS